MQSDNTGEASKLDTPILMLVFNRPQMTKRVLEVIRRARPLRLYVAADGPRLHIDSEDKVVAQVRAGIEQGVDWDCELFTLFHGQNLGCRRAVSSAIDWFFEQEEEGIILEDDCLPDPTFFHFCDALLKRYRHDRRVMSISGNNFQEEAIEATYSYYFSRYPQVWGWATWRRAWLHYDVAINKWPEIRDGGWLDKILRGDEFAIPYWKGKFQRVFDGQIDTWDHQWTLSCWLQNGLSIRPNCNLVSNLGFGAGATHTYWAGDPLSSIPIKPLDFPLRHPPFMVRSSRADTLDEYIRYKHFPPKRFGWLRRLLGSLIFHFHSL